MLATSDMSHLRGLPGRVLSVDIVGPDGAPVLMIETIPVVAGSTLTATFDRITSPWRQGIWVATAGLLQWAGQSSSRFTIWADWGPAVITVVETDGLVRLYNVWDSGRGLAPESQSDTSGMVAEVLDATTTRYRCNDIGDPPDFEKLVVTIRRD